MGLWGAAQAVAFGLGGVAGTVLADLASHILDAQATGYAAVLAVEGVLFLVAAALARSRVARSAGAARPCRGAGYADAVGSGVDANDGDGNLRCRGGRRRPGRRDGGATTWRGRAWRVLLLDRAGPDQALRRRHPAAARSRLRHPRPPAGGAKSARRAWSRRPPPRSTCRSTAASSAWSTASIFDEWLRERAAEPAPSACTRHLPNRVERADGGDRADPYREAAARRDDRIRARRMRHRRRRRPLGGGAARSRAREKHRLRLRLPRDRRARRWTRRTSTGRAATSTTTARLSPDFYAWVFPHGDTTSVGVGSARQGLLAARRGRAACAGPAGLDETADDPPGRRADPAQPLKRWDNGHDVVLAGDAAGVVAPASGEGIYYAMDGGAARRRSGDEFLATGDARALAMRAQVHERPWPGVLGARHDAALLVPERQAARALRQHVPRSGRAAADLGGLHEQGAGAHQPVAHARIFFKDMAHLLGLARV